MPEKEKKSGNEGVRVSVCFFEGFRGTFGPSSMKVMTNAQKEALQVLTHRRQRRDCFPLPVPPVFVANRSPYPELGARLPRPPAASACFPWSQAWLVLAEGMETETSLNFWELSLKERAMSLFPLFFWLACQEMEQWPWT